MAAGEIKQLTRNTADDLSPSVSADGKRMVFESTRNGKRVVWAKDLDTGKERPLSDMPSSENLPILSTDGSQVVYLVYNALPHATDGLYVVPFEGGPSRRVCDSSCDQPLNWTAGNTAVVYNSVTDGVGVLDIGTGNAASAWRMQVLGGGACAW